MRKHIYTNIKRRRDYYGFYLIKIIFFICKSPAKELYLETSLFQ